MTKYMNVPQGQVAYDVEGEGQLVVCVPSLGDMRGEYRFLMPLLTAAGFKVAVMDVRGHGETSKTWDDFSVVGVGQDILALIRELNAGPAIVIGTSMGGGAAIWASVESPDLVKGMILVNPFVDGDSDRLLVAILSVLFARPWGPAMWKKYYTSLYPTHKPADFDQYLSNLKMNIQEEGRLEALMKMLRASKRASGDRMGQVTQPALVIMGSKDPDFKNPAAEGKRVAQALRGSVEIIDQAGHYPHAEMPGTTAEKILSFIYSMEG